MASSGITRQRAAESGASRGHQYLHARAKQVQDDGSMALRAADLVADDVTVETSMSALLAAWSSSLWSLLFASRLFTSRLFAGTSWLMPVAMVSSLPEDPRREYS
ncbi:hypothetical protein PF005_g31090 [Phytophthora fragariae]|uniref:Uncharacterized protein n=1 Tax=Phytophthora fragariae TaxID=53985 RepID=A0A6A3VIZ9_9STRA|nr:hypothetical protein PF005_g31090 [Phytophthora fragariae]